MSKKFPVKKFVHVATGSRLEGEVVLESSTAWQVAVAGKVQVLNKNEWSETFAGFTPGSSQKGGFEDLFSSFGLG
jgi:hypothetical protein